MKKIIENAIQALGKRKRLFHSEAEFQFHLAWEIKNINNDIEIDFEFPYDLGFIDSVKRSQIDLGLRLGESYCAIELKFAKGEFKYDEYDLRGKPADECNEVFRDLMRMEKYLDKEKTNQAFVIVIANNPSYWVKPSDKVENAKSMYLTQAKIIKPGLYEYRDGSSLPIHTKSNVMIRGSYYVDWREYCEIEDVKNGKFRYLTIQVK